MILLGTCKVNAEVFRPTQIVIILIIQDVLMCRDGQCCLVILIAYSLCSSCQLMSVHVQYLSQISYMISDEVKRRGSCNGNCKCKCCGRGFNLTFVALYLLQKNV